MARFGRDGDPRRVGFVVVLLSGLYVALLFVPEPWLVRLAVVVLLSAAFLPLIARVPLPQWREAEGRKQTAMRAMAVEAAVIAAVATGVRIAFR
jgi:hypothetical protein